MIAITEQIDVPSPPDRVWQVISDPSAVVSCVGGAELGESQDDGSFDAVLVVKFGGIQVKFAARVALELDEAGREGRLSARGRDGQGATRFSGNAVFRVTDAPAGGSQVEMNGEMNLSGKLASLIESGAGVVVKRMTREFSEALVQLCATEPVLPATATATATATAGTDTGTHTGASAGPSAGADTSVSAVATAPGRPGLWQRVRERLARLFGRGRSLPPAAGTPSPAQPSWPAQPSPPARPADTAGAADAAESADAAGSAPSALSPGARP